MYMKGHSTANCPTAKTAALLSDVWTMLIVRDLMKHSMRFCDLHESLVGISTRTLTIKLQKLENEGILAKKEMGYVITKKGQNLASIFAEMTKYGKKYLSK